MQPNIQSLLDTGQGGRSFAQILPLGRIRQGFDRLIRTSLLAHEFVTYLDYYENLA